MRSTINYPFRIFELGFVYNAQSPALWDWNLSSILNSTAEQLTFQEVDGSQVIYLWDATLNAYVSPSGAHSNFQVIYRS